MPDNIIIHYYMNNIPMPLAWALIQVARRDNIITIIISCSGRNIIYVIQTMKSKIAEKKMKAKYKV